MEKVYNSVQQITAECDKLLELTKDCGYYDVKALASSVDRYKNELIAYFDKNSGDTIALNIKKRELEDLAIRLEFYVANRLKECTERYESRKYAKDVYDYCREKFYVSFSNEAEDKNIKLMWGHLYRWAQSYYVRSMHILFCTEQEDNEMIRKISRLQEEEKMRCKNS